jgi:hypothetical protein
MNTKTLLALLVGAFILTGCAAFLTPKLDDTTGTTLDERCLDYQATKVVLEVRKEQGELNDTEEALLDFYKAAVDLYCYSDNLEREQLNAEEEIDLLTGVE